MYEVFLVEIWQLIKYETHIEGTSPMSFGSSVQAIYNFIHGGYKGDTKKITILRQAWINMKKRLTAHFGSQDRRQWIWGSFHHDVMKQLPFGEHPVLGRIFNKVTSGWGNMNTPNVGMCSKMEIGNFETTFRANYRSIFDFGG